MIDVLQVPDELSLPLVMLNQKLLQFGFEEFQSMYASGQLGAAGLVVEAAAADRAAAQTGVAKVVETPDWMQRMCRSKSAFDVSAQGNKVRAEETAAKAAAEMEAEKVSVEEAAAKVAAAEEAAAKAAEEEAAKAAKEDAAKIRKAAADDAASATFQRPHQASPSSHRAVSAAVKLGKKKQPRVTKANEMEGAQVVASAGAGAEATEALANPVPWQTPKRAVFTSVKLSKKKKTLQPARDYPQVRRQGVQQLEAQQGAHDASGTVSGQQLGDCNLCKSSEEIIRQNKIAMSVADAELIELKKELDQKTIDHKLLIKTSSSRFFDELQQKDFEIRQKDAEIQAAAALAEDVNSELCQRNDKITDLKLQVEQHETQMLKAAAEILDLQELSVTIKKKDSAVNLKDAQIERLQKVVSQKDFENTRHEKKLNKVEQQYQNCNIEISQKTAELREKDSLLEQLQEVTLEKDTEIEQLKQNLIQLELNVNDKVTEIGKKASQINEKDMVLQQLLEVVPEKDAEIEKLKKSIDQYPVQMSEKDAEISQKAAQISEQDTLLQQLLQVVPEKDTEIEQLKKAVDEYPIQMAQKDAENDIQMFERNAEITELQRRLMQLEEDLALGEMDTFKEVRWCFDSSSCDFLVCLNVNLQTLQ